MMALDVRVEYLDEIRARVCARCAERPPDGPPCAARGKFCGIELYLPKLVDAIQEVRRRGMTNFSVNAMCRVCQHCVALGYGGCPCPMDSLLPHIVEAVDAVDRGDEQELWPGEGYYYRVEQVTYRQGDVSW
jgi:hypothetical protein